MNRHEINRLKVAMKNWAGKHPRGDEPFLHIAGSSFTPVELANAVNEENELGRFQIRVFEYSIESGLETFDEIIGDLERHYSESENID
jgi:hypothetical protein